MNKATVTYMKREYKKVLPVFVLAILYIGFIFGNVYMELADTSTEVLLSFCYTSEYGYFELGNMFVGRIVNTMETVHMIFILIFEFLLIQRVFYQENRAGVSDFLRILPIREKNKVAIKALAGESVIAAFCLLFGAAGSLTYAVLAPGLTEAVGFFQHAGVTVDPYLVIWQVTLLMFLALSVIFCVMFLTRMCIHNQVLAAIGGVGILFVPVYYSYIFHVISGGIGSKMYEVAQAFTNPLPRAAMFATEDNINRYVAVWESYSEKVIFLLVLAAVVLIAVLVSMWKKWNIRESNSTIVNSPGVAEFFVTGFSFSVGMGWNFLTGSYSYGMSGTQLYVYFIESIIVGAIVWAVIHGIGFGIMKRQKGA